MRRIQRYADKRFNNLEEELVSYRRSPEVETLHRIRVEIKKIKALLLLIKYCTRKFRAHKTFVPLRTIFRKAGEIRQPDIFYKLLLLYQIKGIPDAAVPKARVSTRLKAVLVKQMPTHVKTVIRQQEIVNEYISKVSMNCVHKYLRRRKKHLQSELYPTLSLDRLHKSRKAMKEIIYLSGLEKTGSKKQDKFYRKAETLVGRWHDRQMLTFELIRRKATAEVKRLTAENEADIRRIKKMVRRYYELQDGK